MCLEDGQVLIHFSTSAQETPEIGVYIRNDKKVKDDIERIMERGPSPREIMRPSWSWLEADSKAPGRIS